MLFVGTRTIILISQSLSVICSYQMPNFSAKMLGKFIALPRPLAVPPKNPTPLSGLGTRPFFSGKTTSAQNIGTVRLCRFW